MRAPPGWLARVGQPRVSPPASPRRAKGAKGGSHARAQPRSTPTGACACREGRGWRGVCKLVGAAARPTCMLPHPRRRNEPQSRCLPCQSRRCLPHRHRWATGPLSPGKGGCVPPAEATGSSGCYHPAAPPWSSSAFPRPSWRAPGLPAQAAPRILASPPGWLGTRASPIAEPEAPVQDLRQLCPLPAPGVPLVRAGDPAGWQPRGPPRSASSTRNAGAGEQGGTPHSCLPQPWQGEAQPSGKRMGPAPSTSRCLGAGSPVPEQPALSREGAARSGAESLSRDGKYHPGQICLHSIYSRERQGSC